MNKRSIPIFTINFRMIAPFSLELYFVILTSVKTFDGAGSRTFWLSKDSVLALGPLR